MLSQREDNILKILIREYIATAMPVASGNIARKYGLAISPATIRNEMARLEEKGFVRRPHTSAGCVPTTKGYRYYVEVLLEESELPEEEQRLIWYRFHQTRKEVEEWIKLAAAILSQMLHCVGIVTWPKLTEPHLKLIELISLRDFLALLILILEESKVRQQFLEIKEILSQEELNFIAQKLTSLYTGLTLSEIKAKEEKLSPVEEQVRQALIELMRKEKEQEYEEPYVEGLSLLLSNPEFAKSEKVRAFMRLIEERALLKSILAQVPHDESLRVIIGSEYPEFTMQELSAVMGRYGLPNRASGVIGVIGPARMPYERAFSAVRFLSSTISELLSEVYGEK